MTERQLLRKYYGAADEVNQRLQTNIMRTYRNSNLLYIDELSSLSLACHNIQTHLMKLLRTSILSVGRSIRNEVYEELGKQGKKAKIDGELIEVFLLQYNPVTKYVYTHEIDRRMARFVEALMATPNPSERAVVIDREMKSTAKMFRQAVIDVSDLAHIESMKAAGVKYVEWFTVKDERRCLECAKLHGKIFPITAVPPKPHFNCRCMLIPTTTKKRK